MFRKLLPPLRRRRRIVLVASLPVVLAGAVLALTGGAGSGTAARGAHVGLVRAANTAAGGAGGPTLASPLPGPAQGWRSGRVAVALPWAARSPGAPAGGGAVRAAPPASPRPA